MKKIIGILCITLLIVSCGSSKKTTTKKEKQDTVKVDRKKKKAKKETEVVVVEEAITETPEVYANKTEEYIAIFSDIAQNSDEAGSLLRQRVTQLAHKKGLTRRSLPLSHSTRSNRTRSDRMPSNQPPLNMRKY